MFTVILAVDDDEDRAIAQAEAVAEYPCAVEEIDVIVIHVSREVQSDEGGTIHIDEYADPPSSISKAVDSLEAEGISVEFSHRSGDPAEEIMRSARDENANQIVLSGRRRSPVGKAMFGSVVQDVILNADRPVVTVRSPK